MILIAAVDGKNGMMFNGRRQSRDSAVCRRILKLAQGRRLWMNSYSKKLFDGYEGGCIWVDEDFLEKGEEGDFCFVENRSVLPYTEKVEKVILFRWNRVYPSDFYFDLEVPKEGWRLAETFSGTSHEEIRVEVYER